MIQRISLLNTIDRAIERSRVVVLTGPRQCGKTTLARELLDVESINYFDLEDPASLARLDEPMTALKPLEGLIVIDEIQRRPELFPILRVLADRAHSPARFLILGSASGDLMRQTSESLAGRLERVEMGGFSMYELGLQAEQDLWLRGGFPLSYLALERCRQHLVAQEFHSEFAGTRSPAMGGQGSRRGTASFLGDVGALSWADLECGRSGSVTRSKRTHHPPVSGSAHRRLYSPPTPPISRQSSQETGEISKSVYSRQRAPSSFTRCSVHAISAYASQDGCIVGRFRHRTGIAC